MKVTDESINANVASTVFLNLGGVIEGQFNEMLRGDPEKLAPLRALIESAKLTTLCVMRMHNGFIIIGKSACVDPKNFDQDLGAKTAQKDAIDQMWPLLGYEMKTAWASEQPEENVSEKPSLKLARNLAGDPIQ